MDEASQKDPVAEQAPTGKEDVDLEQEIADALGDASIADLMDAGPPDASQGDEEAQAAQMSTASDASDFSMQLKRGRITSIRDDDVFVDLAGTDSKLQGVVPLKQFDRSPRPGSVMEFVVERIDEAEGLIHLSRESAVSQLSWDQLQPGAAVEARATGTNKGGLELEISGNIRAFMPAGQVDLQHVESLDVFVGQRLRCVVQKVEHRSRNVVLSRRRYLEQEQATLRKRLLEEIEVGQIREGTVTSLMPYGAFVNIGGLDGLLHISDMSHAHIAKPADAVEVGQQVQVKVLQFDGEAQKVRLGLKQLGPDPWENIEDRFRPGSEVEGRVTRLAQFGAFVEVTEGVEGLIPISELSWSRIQQPSQVLKEGDVVRLKVLQVDTERNRMSLSLKQSQGDPWENAAERFPRNTVVEGHVVRIVDFGAFVEVAPGVEGLVHISELADRRVQSVEDILKVGDEKRFRVLELQIDDRRLKLSLKSADRPLDEDLSAAEQDASGATPPSRPRAPKGTLKGGIGGGGGMGEGLGSLKL